jgi:hypothetical protein
LAKSKPDVREINMESTNPFLGRGTPICGERLIGRKEIIDRVYTRLINKTHCSIVGLPRIGKTSIAKELIRMLALNDGAARTSYVTLDAASSPSNAYQRILMELSNDFVVPYSNMSHDDAYMHFQQTLRKGKKCNCAKIVVFDELDGITRKGFLEASLFLSRIREIANDHDRYGLTFLFISRRSLDTIQGVVDFSTLAGLCEVVYVKPLIQEMIYNLVRRSPIPVDVDAQLTLWEYTGGHPYLAEVLMCETIEKNPGKITVNDIESALLIQSHEFTNQYNQLKQILTPNSEFDYLCELIVGPRWRPIPPQTVNILRQYGLIKVKEESEDEIECLSGHLRDYLAWIARNTPTWHLVGEVENQLRALIADRMYKVYGKDWIQVLVNKHKCFHSIYDDLLLKRGKEQRLFGEAASYALLDYTYISDLKDLLFVEWEKYKDILAGSKSDWDKRFQVIMKVRNPLAHNRQIPADELYYADNTCKVILEILQGIHEV